MANETLAMIEENDWYAVTMDGCDAAVVGYGGTGVDNCVQLV